MGFSHMTWKPGLEEVAGDGEVPVVRRRHGDEVHRDSPTGRADSALIISW